MAQQLEQTALSKDLGLATGIGTVGLNTLIYFQEFRHPLLSKGTRHPCNFLKETIQYNVSKI